MKDWQVLLSFYYLICNKIMYNVKIDCGNYIRIEEFPRVFIKEIRKLTSKT
jgi:hypothetical protein